MQHDQFIGMVQDRARLPSRGDAERLVRATLETLGERVPDGVAHNLASQLPHEIGEHLRRTESFAQQGTGERFDRDEFIGRVALRSGAAAPQASYGARVVLEVIDENTSGSTMTKVRHALPPDLRPLIDSGSTGRVE